MTQDNYDITILPKNSSHVKIKAEQFIIAELGDHFSYDMPGAKFSPKYRSGVWDGKKRLMHQLTKEIYVGLIPFLKAYAEECGYTVNDLSGLPSNDNITIELITEFCKKLNLHSNGNPIEIREYQVNAVYHAIKTNRTTLISPTSSGKSLIAYCIARWYNLQRKKILFIVPNKGLVAQMYKDFEDYSSHNGWNTERNVHQIYAGQSKTSEKLIMLTTWQSIYNIGKGTKKGGQPQAGIPKEYFEQFDVVIGDEVHLFKAASLVGIMERCVNASKRVGLTGTLDNEEINHLVLQGLFGKVKHVITTAELMENGDVTKLDIRCLKINYSNELKKNCAKLSYEQEMDFLVTNAQRNQVICNLAMAQTKNTVIFFQYVEKHGKVIYEMLEQMAQGKKKILYLSGETTLDDREDVRTMIKERDDLIIVASYGVFSTGSNAPNLHIGIFGSPSKSKVRTLQSIGRLLRLNSGKSNCILYDIFDDLSHKSHKNYTLQWFFERVRMYSEAKFKFKIHELPSLIT